jgi:hypothetical protein
MTVIRLSRALEIDGVQLSSSQQLFVISEFGGHYEASNPEGGKPLLIPRDAVATAIATPDLLDLPPETTTQP